MPFIDLHLFIVAATLGWALARGGLCAVAAMQDCVLHGRFAALWLKLTALMIVTCALGGLNLLTGSIGSYAGGGGAWHISALAAAFMAIGAMINGGCYFGSFLYICRGRSDYMMTLLGVMLASRFSIAMKAGVVAHTALKPAPGSQLLAVVTVLALLISTVAAFAALRSGGDLIRTRLNYILLAGVAAALIYLKKPGWSYGGVFASLGTLDRTGFDWSQQAMGVALFGGAIASFVRAGLWKAERLTLVGSTRCLAGGFVMESAAHMIPGGNDALLLWAMPALGLYAVLAYAVLLVVLWVAFNFLKRDAIGITARRMLSCGCTRMIRKLASTSN